MAIGIRDQYFGTEIEMTGITRQRAAEVVAEMFGTRAVCDGGYYGVWSVTDQEGKKWKFMYDGSIYTERRERGRMVRAGSEYSTEMVSPKLSYGEMGKLQEVVRCLRHHGAKVNESCGQHVHVDASNHTPRSLKNAMTIMYSKGCATDRGGLCSLVVLGKCSKMGAFPALWWLFGTEAAGKCLKAHEKCRM